MESMRSTWTDSRLDDFAAETGRRFDRVEQRMDAGFREVRSEIGGVRDEIGALQRTIIQAGIAIFGALVGVIVAILGVIATQL
jgi:hypothetical protein